MHLKSVCGACVRRLWRSVVPSSYLCLYTWAYLRTARLHTCFHLNSTYKLCPISLQDFLSALLYVSAPATPGNINLYIPACLIPSCGKPATAIQLQQFQFQGSVSCHTYKYKHAPASSFIFYGTTF